MGSSPPLLCSHQPPNLWETWKSKNYLGKIKHGKIKHGKIRQNRGNSRLGGLLPCLWGAGSYHTDNEPAHVAPGHWRLLAKSCWKIDLPLIFQMPHCSCKAHLQVWADQLLDKGLFGQKMCPSPGSVWGPALPPLRCSQQNPSRPSAERRDLWSFSGCRAVIIKL